MKLRSKIRAGAVNRAVLALLGGGLVCLGGPVSGAEVPADAKAELKALVAEVKDAIRAGKTNETLLGDELKKFNALLAGHKDEKTEAVAQILFMKSRLYSEVLGDYRKAAEALEQLKRDFPDTDAGQHADEMVEALKHQAESGKIQKALAVGAPFPGFEENDLAGKPLSVSALKGKVVLIDFWATWCPPCRAELPNVITTYEKHHAQGFEIVGVSLDQSQDKLKEFIEEKKMAWPQYFDGKGWGNKLANRYGITSIPATFLLDAEGKIIGRDLRGEDLEAAVAKALSKPAAS